MPGSKNRKGYRRIGKYHRLEGANGNYIAHYENIVLGVGGLDQVNALILQHSSSEQPLDENTDTEEKGIALKNWAGDYLASVLLPAGKAYSGAKVRGFSLSKGFSGIAGAAKTSTSLADDSIRLTTSSKSIAPSIGLLLYKSNTFAIASLISKRVALSM
jgi:hypothetical protein